MPQKVNLRSISTESGVLFVRMDSTGLRPTLSVDNLGTPEPQE